MPVLEKRGATLLMSTCVARNEPNVHLAEELPNQARWHGAELSVTILGNWQYYRAKILRQATLASSCVPHAPALLPAYLQDFPHQKSACVLVPECTWARRAP